MVVRVCARAFVHGGIKLTKTAVYRKRELDVIGEIYSVGFYIYRYCADELGIKSGKRARHSAKRVLYRGGTRVGAS